MFLLSSDFGMVWVIHSNFFFFDLLYVLFIYLFIIFLAGDFILFYFLNFKIFNSYMRSFMFGNACIHSYFDA